MNLAGELRIGAASHYLYLNDVKKSETFLLVDKYHREDAYEVEMGGLAKYPTIDSPYSIKGLFSEDYLLEATTRLKVSGKVKAVGQFNTIETVVTAIAFARNYHFARANILLNEQVMLMNELSVVFAAEDENVAFSYKTINGIISEMKLRYSDVSFELRSVSFSLPYGKLDFHEVPQMAKKKMLLASLKTIDYQTLGDSLDMNWYKKGEELQKDYDTIKTIDEFEMRVMTKMVQKLERCQREQRQLDVSVDSETTGLNVLNLDKYNEDKDHCVAIPIAWEENQAVTVFTDMEHFANVPNEYALSRLKILFEDFDGEREIEIYEDEDESLNVIPHVNYQESTTLQAELEHLGAFDDDFDPFASTESGGFGAVNDLDLDVLGTINALKKKKKKRVVKFKRSDLNLIGHNIMFDGRVFMDVGPLLYFNNDTLQMAFDINPLTVKGANKLKVLTRKVFGHETPELSDILGKGNEDKYKWLVNEEVAKIYGCADADYTRKLYKYLRKLMSPRMYEYYQRQDIPMLNILYQSEYYGMRTIKEDVDKLADQTWDNLEVLKKFTYEYVGMFVDHYKKRNTIEMRKKAGYYASDEEYKEAMHSIEFSFDNSYEFEFKASEIRKVLYDILKYPIFAFTEGKKPLPKTDKFVMKKLIAQKRKDGDAHFNKLQADILVAGSDRAEFDALMASGNEKKIKKASSMVLVSAKDFNGCKHPLALVLAKYAEINKEYTSYYKPIKEQNLEGKIFKGYSLARIETRRIMNPGQTMKGNLKALIRSYSDDYYVLDFDMSQVEYRIMLSLAKFMLMVDRMKDPEKDYHTETASLINGIQAHKVSKKARKNAKSVSFGVPYGLGVSSLAESLFGVVNSDTIFATRMMLQKWEETNRPVMVFLNEKRDEALMAKAVSDELRDFMDMWEKEESGEYKVDGDGNKIPIPIGFATNEYGFYRTFDLSEVDQSIEAQARRKTGRYTSEESAIRRPAGNYPIQAFASELFRIILIRFYNRCKKEGIADKVIWHMLIHDELLCSVHKSIHPFYLYKIVKEACMITMVGHTKYFVGINIGNTWAETKDDSREAPVYFVERMIKRWDAGEFGSGPFWFDDPWEELIRGERTKYVDDRIGEVIHKVQPDIDRKPIDIPHILETFDNYTVRAYVNDYAPCYKVAEGDLDLEDPGDLNEYQDRVWVSRFETWALGVFGVGKPIINFDGKLVTLHKYEDITEAKSEDEFQFVDTADLFEDSQFESGNNWSFDEQEVTDAYDSDFIIYSDEEDDGMYDMDLSIKGATNIAQLIVKKSEHKNLKVFSEQVIITVDSAEQVRLVKKWLESHIAREGLTAMFKFRAGGVEPWLKVKGKTDFKELDSYLSSLRLQEEKIANYKKMLKTHNFSHLRILPNQVVISVNSTKDIERCIELLGPHVVEDGTSVLFKTVLGESRRWLRVSPSLNLIDLDKALDSIVRRM